MKVIVFTGDRGNACILTPAYPAGSTEEQQDLIAAECQINDVPNHSDGTPRDSFIMDDGSQEIVRMGILFDSWRISQLGVIYWDVEAARETKRNQFRAIRKPMLEALDVKFLRAIERGDVEEAEAVAAKKQELRDVTLVDMSAQNTPELLDAFIPEVLK